MTVDTSYVVVYPGGYAPRTVEERKGGKAGAAVVVWSRTLMLVGDGDERASAADFLPRRRRVVVSSLNANLRKQAACVYARVAHRLSLLPWYAGATHLDCSRLEPSRSAQLL